MKKTAEVSIGRTVNTGNFESVRVDVSLRAEWETEMTSEQMFDVLQKKVEERLNSITGPIEKALGDYEDRRKGKGK